MSERGERRLSGNPSSSEEILKIRQICLIFRFNKIKKIRIEKISKRWICHLPSWPSEISFQNHFEMTISKENAKKLVRSYDQVFPKMRVFGQSMFDTSNFGTKLWTSAPNVNFDTMYKDYVCGIRYAEVNIFFKLCRSSFTR